MIASELALGRTTVLGRLKHAGCNFVRALTHGVTRNMQSNLLSETAGPSERMRPDDPNDLRRDDGLGAQQYQDVLDALAAAGLDGQFTQTGGMCAALQVTLDGGYYLLFTDQEDTLSWSRAEHEGWYVGLFEPEERRRVDGPMRYLRDSDGSRANAVELAVRVLRGESEH